MVARHATGSSFLESETEKSNMSKSMEQMV